MWSICTEASQSKKNHCKQQQVRYTFSIGKTWTQQYQWKEIIMTYLHCLRQQIADFFLFVFVFSATYAISSYYGFRNPIELTHGFYTAAISASLVYILFGSFMRYMAHKQGPKRFLP